MQQELKEKKFRFQSKCPEVDLIEGCVWHQLRLQKLPPSVRVVAYIVELNLTEFAAEFFKSS